MDNAVVKAAVEKAAATYGKWAVSLGPEWHEWQTRYALVDPMLRALGWDTSDPMECYPEWRFSHRALRVDYALFPDGIAYDLSGAEPVPTIIIECKSVRTNLASGHAKQLQDYVDAGPGVSEGLAVLTNGHEWRFQLFGDGLRLSRITPYPVDIVHRDPEDAARKFIDYLGRNNW